VSTSIANTRLRRCAQLIATCFGTAGASASCLAPFPPAPRPAGVIAARRRLCGSAPAVASRRRPAQSPRAWFWWPGGRWVSRWRATAIRHEHPGRIMQALANVQAGRFQAPRPVTSRPRPRTGGVGEGVVW
jgi:hypothetical protein